MEFPGPVHGQGLKPLIGREAFAWAKNLAGPGLPVDGCPEHKQRIERGDRAVGVVGGLDTQLEGAGHGADIG